MSGIHKALLANDGHYTTQFFPSNPPVYFRPMCPRGADVGHSQREVNTLALQIQLEKQRDIKQGSFYANPLYYAAKAFYIVYGLAMEPDDFYKFEEEIIKKRWLMSLASQHEEDRVKALWDQMKKNIRDELDTIGRQEHEVRIETSNLQKGVPVALENGMVLERYEDHWTLRFPGGANTYILKPEELKELKDFKEISPGSVRVKLEGTQLVVRLNLINSIGGAEMPRDLYNLNQSLPETEVATRDFVKYTHEVRRLTSGMLRAWRPVRDALGRVRLPRVVMLNGLTGTAKSTLARNLSKVWGVPMYTLNAYEEMRISDMSVGLKFQQGKFELGVKEFFARVGKINGKRIAVPGKVTSNRSILLLDEANASADILYALAPLFRGEKKFSVEYAGESFNVEVDDEVMVLLTFNPSEKYGGRAFFAREIAGYAVKLWAPDPLLYDTETLVGILSEYHRRGIIRGTETGIVPVAGQLREGHEEVQPVIVGVDKTLTHPAVDDINQYLGNKPIEVKVEPEKGTEPPGDQPPAKPGEKVIFKIEYDVQKIRDNVEKFIPNAGKFSPQEGYRVFARDILEGYLLALANGEKDLNDIVLDAARQLDPEILATIKAIIDLYSHRLIKEGDLRREFLELRRIFERRADTLLLLQLMVKSSVPYMKISAEPIERRLYINEGRLTFLGEDPQAYKDDDIKAVMVEDNPLNAKGTLGYFEGEMAIVMSKDSAKAEAVSGVPTKDVVDWVAWHELGHVMDSLRIRKLEAVEQVSFPKKMPWSKRAQLINAFIEKRLAQGGLHDQRRLWISDNLEINSTLFPMIFSPYAKEYAIHQLPEDLKRGPKNAYAQAGKGILNGVLIAKGFSEGQLISDDFEEDRIESAVTLLKQMDSLEINQMAAKFYKEPWLYLSTAKAGVYQIKARVVERGESSIEEIMAGLDGTPDVDITYEEGNKDDQGKSIEIEVGPKPKEGQSTLIREPQEGRGAPPGPNGGDGSRGGGSSEGEMIDETKTTPPSWVKKQMERLIAISPARIRRYLEIFSGTPKTRKIYSESGDAPDLQRLLEGDMDPFASTKVIEGMASLSAGITVDISPSARGALFDAFIQMAKSFSALNYFAGVRNQNLHYSLSGIGTNYHQYLDFDQSKDQTAVETALNKLTNSASEMGINTVAVINGLRQKYRGQMDKRHRLEFVFTDGGEMSDKSFEELRNDLNQLEKSMNLDVVFVGIGSAAREVRNYSKFVYFEKAPSEDQMMDMIESLSILKVKTGLLPQGNLGREIGYHDKTRASQYKATQVVRSDKAMKAPGGIDLTVANMHLQTRNNNGEIKFHMDPAMLKQLKNVSGFAPVIVNMQPLKDVSLFLGLGASNSPALGSDPTRL